MFGAGMWYFLSWGPTVQHVPYWISPGDIWLTYQLAGEVSHGHFAGMYAPFPGFLSFPGILVVLAPLAALTNGLGMTKDVAPSHFVAHPQAWLLLGPFVLLSSSVALFACDALAARIGVGQSRRVVLCIAEALALWNVAVLWGHPEDAIATALAVYAVIFALDGRFVGAGWLFGAAMAFQPLVIVVLPLLVAVGGTKRIAGLVVRGALPGAVLLVAPFVANFHATFTALSQQPGYPMADHATPWTALAPKLGAGNYAAGVAAGPGHIVLLVIAVAARMVGAALARPSRDDGVGHSRGTGSAAVHGIGDVGVLRVAGVGSRVGGRGPRHLVEVRFGCRCGHVHHHCGTMASRRVPVVGHRDGGNDRCACLRGEPLTRCRCPRTTPRLAEATRGWSAAHGARLAHKEDLTVLEMPRRLSNG